MLPVFVKVFIKKVLFYTKRLWIILFNYYSIEKIYHKRFCNRRIGLLHNHAIGPFALFAEQHLRTCEVHNLHPKRDVVLISSNQPCNNQLQKMVEREISVIRDDTLFKIIETGGQRFLKNKGLYTEGIFQNGVIYNSHGKTHIAFNEDEISYGNSLLKKLGVEEGQRFVLVHNKDNLYWQSREEDKPWDLYRNSPFEDLLPSVDFLKKQGLAVIRSGYYQDFPDAPYISLNNCTREEVDFLDIFLQKYCLFSICGDSGIAWIPYLFKTPTLIYNFIPMGESPPVEKGIFLPKLLKRKGELLTIKEMLQIHTTIAYPEGSYCFIRKISSDRFQNSNLYRSFEIDIIDNAPEEILQAVKEMIHYVKGRLSVTKEEELLQTHFKESFPVGHPMRHQIGLVSPNFLRKNQILLG